MSTNDLDDLADKVEELSRQTHDTATELQYVKKGLESVEDAVSKHAESTDKRFDSIHAKLDGLVTGQNTMAVNIASGSKRWTAVEIGSIGTVLAALLSGLGGIVLAANGKELPPVVIPAPAIERRVDEQAP